MPEVQLDRIAEIRERWKDKSWPNIAYFAHGQAVSDIEHLLSAYGIAHNALENIKYWKTFGVQNNPHEIVAHANAALKEIAAVATQTPEGK